MRHTLLVDSSDYEISGLFDIFKELMTTGVKLTVVTNRPAFYKSLASQAVIEDLPKFFNGGLMFRGLAISKFLKKRQITKVVMVGSREKLKSSSLVEKNKLPIVWLELPEERYVQFNHKKLATLALAATGVKAVCLTSSLKQHRLDLAWPELSLTEELPALKFPDKQEFKTDFPWLKRPSGLQPVLKLGTVVDLTEVQRVEELLRLTKSCLELGMPIQLIIIGDGEEREKISWLVKKMELENLVWLVGNRGKLNYWYAFFDVLAIANRETALRDLVVAVEAASFELPILAQTSEVLNNLIIDGETGEQVDFENIEKLAAIVMRLAKDKTERQRLGRKAKQLAEQLYYYPNKINKWLEILN